MHAYGGGFAVAAQGEDMQLPSHHSRYQHVTPAWLLGARHAAFDLATNSLSRMVVVVVVVRMPSEWKQ